MTEQPRNEDEDRIWKEVQAFLGEVGSDCSADSVESPVPVAKTPDDPTLADDVTLDRVRSVWGKSLHSALTIDLTLKTSRVHTTSALTRVVVKSRQISEGAMRVGPLSDAESLPDYELLEVLGEGGMGVIYAARQTSMDREIALKMVKPEVVHHPQAREKFLAEATVTGDLDHPNIVPVYDLGADERGRLFFAMKRVKGDPWSRVIRDKPQRENLDILLRVTDAMAFAHSRGVVHRDLKPQNVMLGDFGEVMVMDWGLAVSVTKGGKAEPIAQATTMGGTPAYLAPEMARGQADRIGFASDVYLLGAILFEILTGHAPHTGKTVTDCLHQAASNVIWQTDEKGELVEIALRAMATEPADRFASVQDFQLAIREYRAHSESIALATRAQEALDRLKEGAARDDSARYVEFAEVVGRFRQALELWDENDEAVDGLTEGLEYFVKAALEGDDLGLANAQLRELENVAGEDDARCRHLRVRWEALDKRQRHRRHLLRASLAAVIVLLLTVLIGGTISYHRIQADKTQAVNLRGIADEKRRQAEESKKAAVQAKEQEKEQREIAERNERAARKARTRAEQAAVDLKVSRETEANARQLAERTVVQLIRQQQETQAALKQVEQEHLRAEERERIARRNLALVDIQRARATINGQRDYPRAAQYLLRALRTMDRKDSDDARRLLAQVLQASPRLLDAPATPRAAAVLQPATPGGVFCVLTLDGKLWSPDAETPLAGAPRDALLWNGRWVVLERNGGLLVDGKPLSGLGPSRRAYSAAVETGAGDGGARLAVGGFEGRVVVLDPGGSPVLQVPAHLAHVTALAFRPGRNQLVSGGADGLVCVWDLKARTRHAAERAHSGFIGVLAVSADGLLIATGGADGLVRVWEADTLIERASLAGHKREVGGLAFHPVHSWVISQAWDGTLRLWDWTRPDDPHIATLGVGNPSSGMSLVLDAAGERVACVGADDRVITWDLSDRSDDTPDAWRELIAGGVRLLPTAGSAILAGDESMTRLDTEPVRVDVPGALAVLDARRVVCADGFVRDIQQGRRLASLGRPIVAAAARNGRLVAAAADGTLLCVDLADEPFAPRASGRLKGVTGLALSPEGKIAAWANGRLFVGTPESLAPLPGAELLNVQQALWDRDGRRLFVRDNSTRLLVVDAAGGARFRLTGHAGIVRAMSLSGSGRWLASAGFGGQVRLWDLHKNAYTAPIVGLSSGVAALVLADDATHVICLLANRRLRRFRLPTADMDASVDQLAERVRRWLGVDELRSGSHR